MASRPDHQSLPGTTALAGFDPIIFLLIRDTPSEEVYVLNMFRMRGSRL